MVTYSKLGHPRRGRLGNSLFQIASTVGLAYDNGQDFRFPDWSYAKHFPAFWPHVGDVPRPTYVPESAFNYRPETLAPGRNWDVDGWRQSEEYFLDAEAEVRELLTFSPEIRQRVHEITHQLVDRDDWRPLVAVSVRRGDFVGNPNYAQLPITYYLNAILDNFPDLDAQFLVFSDDLAYCRVHFEALPHVWFADGLSDVEQLALMQACHHFVISNSTFSWWGAWLGEDLGSVVVRPPRNFAGELAEKNDERDYWPKRWTVGRLDRLDLTDTTFTVPVFIDHPHRAQNLELSVCVLQRDLDTHVLIGEQGSAHATHMATSCQYGAFPGLRRFHRTKMLNDMAKAVTTPLVVNWDADVFVPPLQHWLAADALRRGADVVYPFDGRCARVPRSWHQPLERALDIGIVGDTEFKGKATASASKSVGCAIYFNRAAFLAGGGENEKMISFGPEDVERWHRFHALGYDVRRIPGALYHLDHWCGPDSSSRNPDFKRNHQELKKIQAMDAEQLAAYVEAWPWRP